jgi:hypothetical protein
LGFRFDDGSDSGAYEHDAASGVSQRQPLGLLVLDALVKNLRDSEENFLHGLFPDQGVVSRKQHQLLLSGL